MQQQQTDQDMPYERHALHRALGAALLLALMASAPPRTSCWRRRRQARRLLQGGVQGAARMRGLADGRGAHRHPRGRHRREADAQARLDDRAHEGQLRAQLRLLSRRAARRGRAPGHVDGRAAAGRLFRRVRAEHVHRGRGRARARDLLPRHPALRNGEQHWSEIPAAGQSPHALEAAGARSCGSWRMRQPRRSRWIR